MARIRECNAPRNVTVEADQSQGHYITPLSGDHSLEPFPKKVLTLLAHLIFPFPTPRHLSFRVGANLESATCVSHRLLPSTQLPFQIHSLRKPRPGPEPGPAIPALRRRRPTCPTPKTHPAYRGRHSPGVHFPDHPPCPQCHPPKGYLCSTNLTVPLVMHIQYFSHVPIFSPSVKDVSPTNRSAESCIL